MTKSPIYHDGLRALLRIVERAIEQDDSDALEDALVLGRKLDFEQHANINTYINGSMERLASDYDDWFMYNKDQVIEAKRQLEKVAYGDFDEAMRMLENDLYCIDRYRNESDIESNVFRSDFFDNDDRKKWHELRSVMLKYFKVPYSENQNDEIENAMKELREYQQKSYGPLIPTMTATYIKRYANGADGATLKLIWIDGGVRVDTAAPFYEEIDDYFINQSPIKNRQMFIPSCFPESFGEYKLGDTDSVDLFRWEL